MLGLHQPGTASALRASWAGQAAYDMGWGDAEGNCLPRGVIKTTFFGSIRWGGGFFRRCWKAQDQGNHGKGPPERGPPPAQLVLRVEQGLWGSAHLGKLCPCCLVAIVNLRYNHCRGFGAWKCFYPFVSGFSVAASYLFFHFGLDVFQGFLFFF